MTPMIFTSDAVTGEKSVANRLTRDQKTLFTLTMHYFMSRLFGAKPLSEN